MQANAALSNRAREVIKACPEWYHSIELAPGVITPGRAPLDVWTNTLAKLNLPDLHDKTVLDIGAYDGFFSFAAERLGARRVVALDDYVWCTDMQGYMAEWREARHAGKAIPSPRNSKYWQPDQLPGKRPFDAAKNLLDSHVEPVVGNFMNMEPSEVGHFDVVLFLGILYHMEEPLTAMRRAASFLNPGGFFAVETEAMDIPCIPQIGVLEFFPTNELNSDASNWWAPNVEGLKRLMLAAGLVDCQIHQGPPQRSGLAKIQAKLSHKQTRFRAIATGRSPR
jgi:tRNA (mo5U34)-methyltransferase